MENIKQHYVKIEYTEQGPSLNFFLFTAKELSEIPLEQRIKYLTENQAESIMNDIFNHITLVRKNNKLFETEQDLTILRVNIANTFDLNNHEVLNAKLRKREVVAARNIFFTMLTVGGYGSQTVIGKTCNKDRTTVIHSMKSVKNVLQTQDYLFYNKTRSILEKYKMYQKTMSYLEKHVK